MIARVVLLAAGVALAAGCSTPAEQAPVTHSPTSAADTGPNVATALPPPTTVPAITGTVEPGAVADQAAKLSGAARGTMALAIDGLGRVDSSVTGDCAPSGATTTVSVSAAGSTKIVVVLAAGESTVHVTDAGLDMKATLLAGEFTVAKPKLTIATKFRPAGADSPGGRLDLSVTCGP